MGWIDADVYVWGFLDGGITGLVYIMNCGWDFGGWISGIYIYVGVNSGEVYGCRRILGVDSAWRGGGGHDVVNPKMYI